MEEEKQRARNIRGRREASKVTVIPIEVKKNLTREGRCQILLPLGGGKAEIGGVKKTQKKKVWGKRRGLVAGLVGVGVTKSQSLRCPGGEVRPGQDSPKHLRRPQSLYSSTHMGIQGPGIVNGKKKEKRRIIVGEFATRTKDQSQS